MPFCSSVTLSLGTMAATVAVVLLAVAFATDNWLYIEVRRENILKNYRNNTSSNNESTTISPANNSSDNSSNNSDDGAVLEESVNSKYYYFTRTKGLFRVCFPNDRPHRTPRKTYLASGLIEPLETRCSSISYYNPKEHDITGRFTDDAWTRVHMGRSMIALFVLAFVAVFGAFCTGVTGCWKRSPGYIAATAILMLLACLLSAGAMGLWHAVDYFENTRLVGEEFQQQWSEVLQENTTTTYDWSYILAWLGVVFALGAFLLFCFAACCLGADERANAKQQTSSSGGGVKYVAVTTPVVYPQNYQYAYPAPYPAPVAQTYAEPYCPGASPTPVYYRPSNY